MRHVSYTNKSGATRDCRVLRLAGTSDTSGVVVKDYPNIAKNTSFIYTPSLSGLYSVATKVRGTAADYVIDKGFDPVYITAVHNNSASPIISGYSLKEFSDYYKLKLHLTDNMNSDVQFQNFTFEILYSYVDGEDGDYNAAFPEFTSALSPIIHGAKEHSSGGRYSYPVMMIRENEGYAKAHNIKAASDFYSYQHKAMFIGDTIMIPKINGQAEVGRYLIFSIRRRPLDRSITETSVISQCFSAPVTIETSYNKIAALETGVDALEAVTYLPISGAPVIPAKAFVHTGVSADWEIKWEAVTAGAAGNKLSITISPGTGKNSPIAVTVDNGVDVMVTLATNDKGESDDAANTATNVCEAVNGDETAGLLIQGTRVGSGGACREEERRLLSGGEDGTPGADGQMRFGDDKVFISVGESTATIYNWKYVALT